MTEMQIDKVDDGIDEGLYSRQLYVLGREAMKRMSESNVLIVGLKGLGVEIAKNVALAGVKSISLHDNGRTEIEDLSSQFFLTEADVGQPRALVSQKRLAELNQYTPVSVVTEELDESIIKRFQVVVLTETDLETQVKINQFTHDNDIKFISTDTRGLFGSAFIDFGKEFIIIDKNGEEQQSGIVSSIEPDGTVTVLDESRHGLEDGDWVKFLEIEGMEKLNDGQPRQVKVLGPYTFNIGDVSQYGTYKNNGLFLQVKMPSKTSFEPLEKQLARPEYFVSDFAKFDRPPQLHIAFLTLHAFKTKNNRLPLPHNDEDANQFVHLAEQLAVQYPDILDGAELNEKLIRQVSYLASGDLAPMNAVFGGLIAQEVLKACSGKFTPIKQWFYFDSLESLPKGNENLTESDFKAEGSRYDRIIAVFGRDYVDRLKNLRVFLVGAGAIGCEMLKNWAMLGIGSGPNGKIFVTDNDSIEKSNLNRQFLFRARDVGKMKSEVAAAAVSTMNPDLKGNIEPRSDKVGPETETLFNDEFWQSLDFVANALDNIDARTYVDRRCILFRKPLLESGTLGTKGNVQVVYPDLTESYSSSHDPPEKSIPLCTLRSFPNKIEHTIAWARNLFISLFQEPAENVNLYLSQSDFVESTLKQAGDQKEILENIYKYLVGDKPLTFEQCIVWAFLEFEKRYNHDIRQLLFNFPKDSKTTTGQPFWSGPKRAPVPLEFDINNENHLSFVIAGANLHAFNYGLKGDVDRSLFEKVLATTEAPEFSPTSTFIALTDEEAARRADKEVDQDELGKIIEKLPPPSTLAGFRLHPVVFEKDDDSNFHIDFINAASNLRALNYGIEPAERSKTKFIAGRIIPAIATTTALVTGLVCLELFKIVDGKNKVLEDFKNGFINLALPFFGFSDPIASTKYKYNDKEIDKIWGRFDVNGDPTLEQFIADFKEKEGLSITMVSSGTTLLYASFYPAAKLKDRLKMKLSQLLETISKKPLPEGTKSIILEVCADDLNDEDVEVPFVSVHLDK